MALPIFTVIALPFTVTVGFGDGGPLTNETVTPAPDSPKVFEVNRTFALPFVFKSDMAVADASVRTGDIGAVSRVPIRSRKVLDGKKGPGSESMSVSNRNVAVFADALYETVAGKNAGKSSVLRTVSAV